jgi:hypothetical protein
MLKNIGIFALLLSALPGMQPVSAFAQEYYHRDRDYYGEGRWNNSRRHEHREEERREHRRWREHERREHEWRQRDRPERHYYDRHRYSPYASYFDRYGCNYPR